jgi:integrase
MRININEIDGSIVIRFSLPGYRFQITIGKATDENKARAVLVSEQIKADIKAGVFVCRSNPELKETYLGKIKINIEKKLSLNEFMQERLKHDTHNTARSFLSLCEKFDPKIIERNFPEFIKFLVKGRKITTIKRYATYVSQWDAALAKRMLKETGRELEAYLPSPFTQSEVKAILEWFKQNEQTYFDFVKLLFTTGMRTGEAIGLQGHCILWEESFIIVKQSLSVSEGLKGTKTGKIRRIPIPKWFLGQRKKYQEKKLDDFIFTSVLGEIIDNGNFNKRYWKKCLKELGIPYRSIYNTRHTFCSHFLQNGGSLVALAKITHNSKSGIQTLLQHYIHIIEDLKIPDMY